MYGWYLGHPNHLVRTTRWWIVILGYVITYRADSHSFWYIIQFIFPFNVVWAFYLTKLFVNRGDGTNCHYWVFVQTPPGDYG